MYLVLALLVLISQLASADCQELSLGNLTCGVYTNSAYKHVDIDFGSYCEQIWPKVSKVTVTRGGRGAGGGVGGDECMHPMEVSASAAASLPNQHSMIEYLAFLRRHRLKVLIVGDYFSFQMFESLRQNLKWNGQEGAESGLVAIQHEPYFLAPVPGIRYRHGEPQLGQPTWAHAAIKKGVSHIVLNTGVFFAEHWNRLELTETHPNYKKPGQRPNADELVGAFAAQFVRRSPLRKLMDDLRLKHRITFVWRDLTADALCPDSLENKLNNCAHNINLFPVFNAIARKAVLALGGMVIPDVWMSSLGAWQDHYQGKDGQPLRWCLSSPVPVPYTWNLGLYELLLAKYKPVSATDSCAPYPSDKLGLKQDMSLQEYCAKEWPSAQKVTVRHDEASILHSSVSAAPGEKFLCVNDTIVAVGSAPTLPRHSMVEFMTFLRDKEFKLLFVGDSLTGEMVRGLRYNLEAKGKASARNGVVLQTMTADSALLAPLPGMTAYFPDKNLTSTEWAKVALAQNATHIIISTGAWFNPNVFSLTETHPHYKGPGQHPTNDELVAAYIAQFSPGSQLYTLMDTLHKERNIRFIWRDLAAAGACTATGGAICRFDNYHLFPLFNAIARKAVLELGGMVIPDVWSSSLGAWQDHFHPDGRDPLHWCLGAASSLPSLWNSKLYDLFLSEYAVHGLEATAIVNATATPPVAVAVSPPAAVTATPPVAVAVSPPVAKAVSPPAAVVSDSCAPYPSDKLGLKQDMSLQEYCAKEWPSVQKVTISHGLTSAAKVVTTWEKYLCVNDTSVAVGSAPTLPRRSMVEFMKFLRLRKFKIIIVGDSLAGEMFRALKYSLLMEGKPDAHKHLFVPVGDDRTTYLAPIPDMTPNVEADKLVSAEWVNNSLSLMPTHIVINTGAWFGPFRMHLSKTHPHHKESGQHPSVDELVAAFIAQFSPGSQLYTIMDTLHKERNIRFIWRDLAAAGVCTATGEASCNYSNHRLFPLFNAIARKAVLELGGMVIPDVWSSSLGAWQEHLDVNGQDPLHWCLGAASSLPSLWNSKLYDLFLSEYGGGATSG